ncbi:MAG: 50S ribosomal protein L22 [Epsilonproteobacteria bacterium]|nr:50S ribosomal protein L22 [Campylobacterota bacterium]|tara:strand:- start:906 stop:1262 length:357 start_codon:yes stop_codon:yes gene_type:complete
MDFTASAKFIKRSPYKLRPIVDVIRGKNAQYALDWLKVYGLKKSSSIKKLLESAIANAKNKQEDLQTKDLKVATICVDEGPVFKYFKPSAMGRSLVIRKRLSHMKIVLKQVNVTDKQG